jgi:ribonuclease E
MTPEEQDVYAFMGISPLVRLNREIKNPKSVILSVVLPGESDQTQISEEAPVESSDEIPGFSLASNEAETSKKVLVTSPTDAFSRDGAGTLQTVLETSSADAPAATEIVTEPTPRSEDSSRPLIRRRRRRSSAIDDDD